MPSAAARAFAVREDWARVVTAFGAWRHGRSIYRIDAEAAAELADTDLPDGIPVPSAAEPSRW